MRKPDASLDEERPRSEESFLQRFHRRKLEARNLAAAPESPAPGDAGPDAAADREAAQEPARELTDADMPSLESLTENSDYTGFLSDKVSESLRRAALRKLFHSSTFNIVDELDDYAEDFTTFEALGNLVTAEMRHRLDIEAEKRAERLQQAHTEPTLTESNDDEGLEEHGDPRETASVEQSTWSDSEPPPLTSDAESAGSHAPETPESNSHAERSIDT